MSVAIYAYVSMCTFICIFLHTCSSVMNTEKSNVPCVYTWCDWVNIFVSYETTKINQKQRPLSSRYIRNIILCDCTYVWMCVWLYLWFICGCVRWYCVYTSYYLWQLNPLMSEFFSLWQLNSLSSTLYSWQLNPLMSEFYSLWQLNSLLSALYSPPRVL